MRTLSIILPTLNEELAIEEVVRQCKEAKTEFLSKKLFDEVEIIIVNDGSTDRTGVVLAQIGEIRVLAHREPKGYGAALKSGFREAKGKLLAFLDADGTYDPRELPNLATLLRENGADMVIGNRMQRESKMPLVRKIGNKVIACLIRFVGKTKLDDATSGMRIFKRDILRSLEPLPSGLEFTTAMTTKAVLAKNLKIVYTPISYRERIGASKLRVLRDGPRALWSIFRIAFRGHRATRTPSR